MNIVDLGRAIQDARNAKKLTQQELAAKVGIREGFLADIERGVGRAPCMQVLADIANVLDVPILAFMVGKRPKH